MKLYFYSYVSVFHTQYRSIASSYPESIKLCDERVYPSQKRRIFFLTKAYLLFYAAVSAVLAKEYLFVEQAVPSDLPKGTSGDIQAYCFPHQAYLAHNQDVSAFLSQCSSFLTTDVSAFSSKSISSTKQEVRLLLFKSITFHHKAVSMSLPRVFDVFTKE